MQSINRCVVTSFAFHMGRAKPTDKGLIAPLVGEVMVLELISKTLSMKREGGANEGSYSVVVSQLDVV